MDFDLSTSVFILAFGLGLLHAFDADHVMAVTGLSAGRPGVRQSLGFCLRWALGHGLVLMLVALAVYGFGVGIPPVVSAKAEALVGLVLIVIGAWTLYDMHKHKRHLHFHRHDNLPAHAHWHSHADESLPSLDQDKSQEKSSHSHNHSATLVGMLHGTAGSAPLLLVVPLTQLHSAWLAFAYVGLFCVGVVAAMLICGGLMGQCFKQVSNMGEKVARLLRTLIACASMLLGGYLLFAA